MAYVTANFRKIDGIPGQAFFTYITADLASVFEASGYFDSAITEYGLSTGDIIMVVSTDTAANGDLYVATNTSGTATVTQRT
jgi:hypothetical protein